MANELYDIQWGPGARAFLNSLGALDQAEITRIVTLLRADPWTDGSTKFQFVSQVVVLNVYDDGEWVVVYCIRDEDRLIQIWGVERSDPERRRRFRY